MLCISHLQHLQQWVQCMHVIADKSLLLLFIFFITGYAIFFRFSVHPVMHMSTANTSMCTAFVHLTCCSSENCKQKQTDTVVLFVQRHTSCTCASLRMSVCHVPTGSRCLTPTRSSKVVLCSFAHAATYARTHTHKQHTAGGAEGSVMDSPEHVCVAANALRQGTWFTTAPEGARGVSGEAHAADRSQHQTSFWKENSTQRPVFLRLSASITVTFSNRLHASVHLAELELNCHYQLWSRGGRGGVCLIESAPPSDKISSSPCLWWQRIKVDRGLC